MRKAIHLAQKMGEGLGGGSLLFRAVQAVPKSQIVWSANGRLGRMNTRPVSLNALRKPEGVTFVPTRRAGLERLEKFASRAGAHYAAQRNFDLGPADRSSVSGLSPWIKHRLITEEEVLAQTFACHGLSGSTKFVQEVFWRSYFKGWMEQHPSVWHHYQKGRDAAFEALEGSTSQKTDYDAAINGRTGIECFDHWCEELKSIGYLHNHARMWFASIWIFTLRLPWELGADFFLRHLIDGDAAANTLSWRWVGGLHTKGKTYLARASNIAQFTNGRFEPSGQLSLEAEPLPENTDHPMVPLPSPEPMLKGGYLLLVTPQHCRPEGFVSGTPAAVLGLLPRTQSGQSEQVRAFERGAVIDAMSRLTGEAGHVTSAQDWSGPIIKAAQNAGTRNVVTSWATVGPVADQLGSARAALERAGLHLHQHQQTYDILAWPHAAKGFFKLKKKIPSILANLGFLDR